jgi:hypothetical protein
MYTLPFASARPVRWFCVFGLNGTRPFTLSLADPGTAAWMSTGLPGFAAPLRTSSACSRCT